MLVFTPKRLHLEGPGVAETVLPAPDSAERYRYSGLKLLFHANGRYFLVPAGWTLSSRTTIVLPDSNEIRLEFLRGPD